MFLFSTHSQLCGLDPLLPPTAGPPLASRYSRCASPVLDGAPVRAQNAPRHRSAHFIIASVPCLLSPIPFPPPGQNASLERVSSNCSVPGPHLDRSVQNSFDISMRTYRDTPHRKKKFVNYFINVYVQINEGFFVISRNKFTVIGIFVASKHLRKWPNVMPTRTAGGIFFYPWVCLSPSSSLAGCVCASRCLRMAPPPPPGRATPHPSYVCTDGAGGELDGGGALGYDTGIEAVPTRHPHPHPGPRPARRPESPPPMAMGGGRRSDGFAHRCNPPRPKRWL